ncbi:hypothetical protein HZC30_03275 [Candidatus Woesearchaeota archaeon]|nr:hypothetical protein [Candidatus Woesearchaeota archaeon]
MALAKRHETLYGIICHLENPDVLLEPVPKGVGYFPRREEPKRRELELKSREKDNTLYRVDVFTLGALYTRILEEYPPSRLPAVMSAKLAQRNAFRPWVIEEYRKNFQATVREKFLEMVRNLELRRTTARELVETYAHDCTGLALPPDSLEGTVFRLAKAAEFETIGSAIKEGAAAYEKMVREKGMPNYRIAREYVEIQEAFRKLSH